MILSDLDIAARIAAGDIAIEPFDATTQLQPASVDLRLGPDVVRWHRPVDEDDDAIDVAKPTPARMTSKHVADPEGIAGGAILIQPGEFLLGTTVERVRIPATLAARVEGRSSIGRLGLAVHVTAGFIDPGFEGQITLEIVNFNPRPIWIRPGMRIAQLVFHELRTAAANPYRGKYQGQTGTTASRAHVDFQPALPHVDTAPRTALSNVDLAAVPPEILERARERFAQIARERAADPLRFATPAGEFSYVLAGDPLPRVGPPAGDPIDRATEIREAEAAFRKLAEHVDTFAIEARIREALEPFVGDALTERTRGAMKAEVQRVLVDIARAEGVNLTPREIALLSTYGVVAR